MPSTMPSKKKMNEAQQVQYFLGKKRTRPPKTEPVWVYLEREMQEMAATGKKPYNTRRGKWLKELKKIKEKSRIERKQKLQALKNDVGPEWFTQLSQVQADILFGLKDNIHKDLIEELPHRTQTALYNLGISPKVSDKVVMKAMQTCEEDPGLFVWNLYTEMIGLEPSVIMTSYDMNSMLLMSALVSIDFDECIMTLEKLTFNKQPPKAPPKPKKPPPKLPSGKMGAYLQQYEAAPVETDVPYGKPRGEAPPPLGNKFKLKSEAALEKAREDNTFLEKRKERNKPKKEEGKETKYKFWKPPDGFRIVTGESEAVKAQQKMLKLKPKVHHMTPYDNLQYHIGGVTFCNGKPCFIINSAITTPTGYIPVHGGMVMTEHGYTIPYVQGLYKPPEVKEACQDTCDCILKWQNKVMSYLESSKCSCGHLYDFKNDGKTKQKFFYKPTKHYPFCFDQAKIFQMDPTDDFIHDTVEEALRSESAVTVSSTQQSIGHAADMKIEEVLGTLMADLADTPLIIPHLPKAAEIPALHEWCRKRVKGPLTEKQDKQNKLYTDRRIEELKRFKFRSPAFTIPFDSEELHGMNWSHRKMIQKLYDNMQGDFVHKNRMKQLQQARLFWGTLLNEKYPDKSFLQCFYTYMPGRLQDAHMLYPYSARTTKRGTAKTCPLR